MTWEFNRCQQIRDYLKDHPGWIDVWVSTPAVIRLHLTEKLSGGSAAQRAHGKISDWIWSHMWASAHEANYYNLTESQQNQRFDEVFAWCEATFGPSAYEPVINNEEEIAMYVDLYRDRLWLARFGDFYFKSEKEEAIFKLRWFE